MGVICQCACAPRRQLDFSFVWILLTRGRRAECSLFVGWSIFAVRLRGVLRSLPLATTCLEPHVPQAQIGRILLPGPGRSRGLLDSTSENRLARRACARTFSNVLHASSFNRPAHQIQNLAFSSCLGGWGKGDFHNLSQFLKSIFFIGRLMSHRFSKDLRCRLLPVVLLIPFSVPGFFAVADTLRVAAT